jgi:hypothetical protein
VPSGAEEEAAGPADAAAPAGPADAAGDVSVDDDMPIVGDVPSSGSGADADADSAAGGIEAPDPSREGGSDRPDQPARPDRPVESAALPDVSVGPGPAGDAPSSNPIETAPGSAGGALSSAEALDRFAPASISPLDSAGNASELYVGSAGDDDAGNGTKQNPYATLGKAFEEAAAVATVYVMDDLTLASEATVAGSPAKGIPARSIALKRAPGSMAPLTLTRHRDAGNDAQSYHGFLLHVANGNALALEGLTIDGSQVVGSNAAVAVYGSFAMNDTTIRNNTVAGMGGGVYVMGDAARFDMAGGTITGNTATQGGSGVYFYSGTMSLSGDVRVGAANDDNGIYLSSNALLTIAGTLGASAHVNIENHQDARVGRRIATKPGGGLTAGDVAAFFWQTIAYKAVAGTGGSAGDCVLAVHETDFYLAGEAEGGSDAVGKGSLDRPFATLTRVFEELPRGAGVACVVHVKSSVTERAIAILNEGDVTVCTWAGAEAGPATIRRGDFGQHIIQVRGGAKLALDTLIIDGEEVPNSLSALRIEGGSEVVTRHTAITRNVTSLTGGGVSLVGGSRLVADEGTVIRGNRAPERMGGALYLFGEGAQAPELVVKGTVVIGDSAGTEGILFGSQNLSLTLEGDIPTGGMLCVENKANAGIGTVVATKQGGAAVNETEAERVYYLYQDFSILPETEANSYVFGPGAATIYVASWGNDTTGLGTKEKPYATIAKAFSAVEEDTPAAVVVMDDLAHAQTAVLSDSKAARLMRLATDEEEVEIRRAAGFTGTMLSVSGSATLTLGDVALDGNGAVATNAGPLVEVQGNTADAVAEVVLDGASLRNNVSNASSPVTVRASIPSATARFVLRSGEMRGNRAVNGGAVSVSATTGRAQVDVEGGEIDGNTATQYGGAVYLTGAGARATLTGGVITNNTAPADRGAAVYQAQNAVNLITVSGSPQVGTSDTDNGIFFAYGAASSIAQSGDLGAEARINIEGRTGSPNALGTVIATRTDGGAATVEEEDRYHWQASPLQRIAAQPAGDGTTYVIDGLKTIYVKSEAGGGNDTAGDGSRDHPFATLRRAFETASLTAQSTVNVMDDVTVAATAAVLANRNIVLRADPDPETVMPVTLTRGTSSTLLQVGADGRLTLEDLTIDGAKETYAGNTTSLVTVSPGSSTGASARFTMESGTLKNNRAGNGGALVAEADWGNTSLQIALRGGSITGNVAANGNGGGMYVSATGSYAGHESYVSLEGTAISGNRAESASASAFGGGGVSLAGNVSCTMDGGAIQGNVVVGGTGAAGGGVFLNAGAQRATAFAQTGGTVCGNSARNGGGLYVSAGGSNAIATARLTGGSVTGNTVTDPAGRGTAVGFAGSLPTQQLLYVGGSVTIGTTGADNGVYLPAGAYKVNQSGSFADEGARVNIEGKPDANVGTLLVTKSDAEVSDTEAAAYLWQPGNGLSVKALAPSSYILSGEPEFYVSSVGDDADGLGNRARPFKTISRAFAAASPAAEKTTVYIMDEVEVPATAEVAGGRNIVLAEDPQAAPGTVRLVRTVDNAALIRVNSSTQAGASLTLVDVTIDGNKTAYPTNTEPLIHVNGSLNNINSNGQPALFTMLGGALTNNHATNGGALRVEAIATIAYPDPANATALIKGGEIYGNDAANGGGAYVFNNTYSGASTVAVRLEGDGVIRDNTASGVGGGVYAYGAPVYFVNTGSPAYFYQTGGTVSGNTASNGGGVYLGSAYNYSNAAGARAVLTGGVITGNTVGAGGHGGAVGFQEGAYHSAQLLYVGASIQIGTSASDNGVYLPAETFTVKQQGDLEADALVVIEDKPGSSAGSVIADKADGATVSPEEAAHYVWQGPASVGIVPSGTSQQYVLQGGAGLYVSAHGDDVSGDGSRAHPFATLAKAFRMALPDDPGNPDDCSTVYVMDDIDVSVTAVVTAGKNIVLRPDDDPGAPADVTATRTAEGFALLEVQNGGVLTLDGLILDGAKAACPENEFPAVYVNAGNATGTAAFILEDGEIRNNHGKDGGAIRGDGYTSWGSVPLVTIELRGGSIHDNEAANGGAVYLYSNRYQSSSLSLTGTTIEGNKATNGGAIALGDNAVAEISGGLITGNTAMIGAAIYHSGTSSVLRVKGSPHIGASATDNGVYLNTGMTISHDGDLGGGAFIVIEDRADIATNSLIASKTANGVNVNDPEAAHYHWQGPGDLRIVPQSTRQYVLQRPSALYVSGSGDDRGGDGTKAYPFKTLARAFDVAAPGASSDVYVMDDTVAPAPATVISGKTITVQADPDAGGDPADITVTRTANDINLVQADGKLTWRDVTLDGAGDDADFAANTKSLVRVGGTFVLESGVLANNHATEGGAIYLNGTAEISGGLITGNTATLGAAIDHHGGTLRVKGSPHIGADDTDNGIYLRTNLTIAQKDDLDTDARINVEGKMSADAGTVIAEKSDGGPVSAGEAALYLWLESPLVHIVEDMDNNTYILSAVSELYVKSTGSDETGFGSREEPFLTIAKAFAVASAVTPVTVYVMDDIDADSTATLAANKSVRLVPDPAALDVDDPAYDPDGVTVSRAATGFAMITVGSGATFTLDGVTLDGKKNTYTNNNQPLIWIATNGSPATFTMESGKLTNNKGGNSGGAVLAETSGSSSSVVVTINDGEISGNTATNGGGIGYGTNYSYGGGTFSLNLNGGEITGNTAINSGGGVSVNNDRATAILTLDGSDITYNTTTGTGSPTYGGGGIYVNSSNTSTAAINLDKGLIANNTAAGNGGGIYVGVGSNYASNPVKSELCQRDVAIEDNSAASGGGIYIAGGSAYALNIVRLMGGTIGGNGEAVAFSGSGAASAPYNQLRISDSMRVGEDNTDNGIVLPVGYTVTQDGDLGTDAHVNIKSKGDEDYGVVLANKVDGEKPDADEALCYHYQSNNSLRVVPDADNDRYILTGSLDFYVSSGGNDVTGDGSRAKPFETLSHAFTRAWTTAPVTVYVMDDMDISSMATLTAGKNVTLAPDPEALDADGFEDDPDGEVTVTRAADGFAMIAVQGGATLTLDGVTLDGARNIYPDNNKPLVDASPAVNNTTTFIMKSGRLVSNDGANGGAIYTYADNSSRQVVITIEGGEISDNTANAGGGIYLENYQGPVTLNLTGGEIENNTAVDSGGALYVRSRGTMALNLSGGDISHNKAGGLVAPGGSNAGSGGGGIYISTESSAPALNLSGVALKENTALRGGGVYLYDYYGNPALNLTAGEIADNSATSGIGGGIYVRNYINSGAISVNLSGGTITGNGTALDFLGMGPNYEKVSVSGSVQVGTSNADNGIVLPANYTVTQNGDLADSARVNIASKASADFGTVIATKTAGNEINVPEAAHYYYQDNNALYVAPGAEESGQYVLTGRTDFYVSGSTGNDTAGDGSRENPLATIACAFERAWSTTPVTVYVMDDLDATATATLGTSTVPAKNVTLAPDPEALDEDGLDDDPDGEVTIRRAGSGFALLAVSHNSTLTLDGVTLDGKKDVYDTNNQPLVLVGAAYNTKAAFTMRSGRLIDNHGLNGGAIGTALTSSNGQALITVEGGEIRGNTATSGGGIYLQGNSYNRNTASANLLGGTISGNGTAVSFSGQAEYERLSLSGSVRIGTSDTDNGIVLPASSAIVQNGDLGTGARVNIASKAGEGFGVLVATKTAGDAPSDAEADLYHYQNNSSFCITADAANNQYVLAGRTVFFVSATGDDGARGTVEHPLRTIAAACALAPAGLPVTVYVMDDLAIATTATVGPNRDIALKPWAEAFPTPLLTRTDAFDGAFLTVETGVAGATLRVEGLTLDGNRSENALNTASLIAIRSVAAWQTARLWLTNVSLVNNRAACGGALSVSAAANALVAVSVNGGRMEGNRATGDGGALYLNNTATGANVRLDLAGVRIAGNEAACGGGLYLNDTTGGVDTTMVSLSDTTLEANGAASYGGAVYERNATLQLADVTSVGNTAPSDEGEPRVYGSAIYAEGGTVKLAGRMRIGADDADNGLYLADPDAAIRQTGDLEVGSNINLEGKAGAAQNTFIAFKEGSAATLLESDYFRWQAGQFRVVPDPAAQSYLLVPVANLYVSLELGDNSSGNGIVTSPYASIQRALEYAATSSYDYYNIFVMDSLSVGAEIVFPSGLSEKAVDVLKYPEAVGEVSLTRAAGYTGQLLRLEAGAVTLRNLSLDGNAEMQNTRPLVVVNGGSLVLHDAVLHANNATGVAGVDLRGAGSTFVMDSGRLFDLSSAEGTAAVQIQDGATFRMEGGEIAANRTSAGAADSAAGVAVMDGLFEMTGGDITENVGGHAVSVSSAGEMRVSGAVRVGVGPADNGIHLAADRTVTITGDLAEGACLVLAGKEGAVAGTAVAQKLAAEGESVAVLSEGEAQRLLWQQGGFSVGIGTAATVGFYVLLDTSVGFLSATADGVAESVDSTRIRLAFDSDVMGLSAGNTTLVPSGDGAVNGGTLTHVAFGVYDLSISGTWTEGAIVAVHVLQTGSVFVPTSRVATLHRAAAQPPEGPDPDPEVPETPDPDPEVPEGPDPDPETPEVPGPDPETPDVPGPEVPDGPEGPAGPGTPVSPGPVPSPASATPTAPTPAAAQASGPSTDSSGPSRDALSEQGSAEDTTTSTREEVDLAPLPEILDLSDGPVPLQAPTGNPIVDILEGRVPLGSLQLTGTWSLLNLGMTLVAVILSLGLVARALLRILRRRGAASDTDEGSERDAGTKSRGAPLRILALAMGVFVLVAELRLEDFSQPMSWINQWTLLIGAAFAVQLLLLLLCTVVAGNRQVPSKRRCVQKGA